jgi:hypothetical protein
MPGPAAYFFGEETIMALEEPVAMGTYLHAQPTAEAWRMREFLRRKMYSVLLEQRGALEKHAPALNGDARDLRAAFDALAAYRDALDRLLGER